MQTQQHPLQNVSLLVKLLPYAISSFRSATLLAGTSLEFQDAVHNYGHTIWSELCFADQKEQSKARTQITFGMTDGQIKALAVAAPAASTATRTTTKASVFAPAASSAAAPFTFSFKPTGTGSTSVFGAPAAPTAAPVAAPAAVTPSAHFTFSFKPTAFSAPPASAMKAIGGPNVQAVAAQNSSTQVGLPRAAAAARALPATSAATPSQRPGLLAGVAQVATGCDGDLFFHSSRLNAAKAFLRATQHGIVWLLRELLVAAENSHSTALSWLLNYQCPVRGTTALHLIVSHKAASVFGQHGTEKEEEEEEGIQKDSRKTNDNNNNDNCGGDNDPQHDDSKIVVKCSQTRQHAVLSCLLTYWRSMDVDRRCRKGFSALVSTVDTGDAVALRMLIEQGAANVHQLGMGGRSLLHRAISVQASLDVLRALLLSVRGAKIADATESERASFLGHSPLEMLFLPESGTLSVPFAQAIASAQLSTARFLLDLMLPKRTLVNDTSSSNRNNEENNVRLEEGKLRTFFTHQDAAKQNILHKLASCGDIEFARDIIHNVLRPILGLQKLCEMTYALDSSAISPIGSVLSARRITAAAAAGQNNNMMVTSGGPLSSTAALGSLLCSSSGFSSSTSPAATAGAAQASSPTATPKAEQQERSRQLRGLFGLFFSLVLFDGSDSSIGSGIDGANSGGQAPAAAAPDNAAAAALRLKEFLARRHPLYSRGTLLSALVRQQGDDVETVALLLRHGAEALPVTYGADELACPSSPLSTAAAVGSPACLRLLLGDFLDRNDALAGSSSKQQQIDTDPSPSALCAASSSGSGFSGWHVKRERLMLATLLEAAARHRRTDTVKMMLKEIIPDRLAHGAATAMDEARKEIVCKALQHATLVGHVEMVALLTGRDVRAVSAEIEAEAAAGVQNWSVAGSNDPGNDDWNGNDAVNPRAALLSRKVQYKAWLSRNRSKLFSVLNPTSAPAAQGPSTWGGTNSNST